MYDFPRVIPVKTVTGNGNVRIKMLSQHLTIVTRYGIMNHVGIPANTSPNAVLYHSQYAGLFPDARMNDRFQSRFSKRQRDKDSKQQNSKLHVYKDTKS